MNLANGLFGLGGLSGATGTNNVPGLLGKYYNPADAKKAKVKQGLLQAGIALLSQRPQLGDGIGQTLGTALRGGMEGAQQAEQDYMNNAMMGYNMDRQSQDDAWQAKTRERQQHAWDSEDQANEARKAFYAALPEDQKRLAQAYPDQFGQLYLQQSMGGAKSTDDMSEYNFARSQGYEGSFIDFQKTMKQAGVPKNMGTIPEGYRADYDENGYPTRLVPIPGSKAASEAEKAAAITENKNSSQATMTDTITTAANNARKLAGWKTTGLVGQALGQVGMTNAAELRRQTDVLKSTASIQSLNAMRRESPTGGALGAVSDKENAMLAAAAGALDPDAAPADYQKALDNYELTLLRIVHGYEPGTKVYQDTRAQEGQAQSPLGNDPLGLR